MSESDEIESVAIEPVDVPTAVEPMTDSATHDESTDNDDIETGEPTADDAASNRAPMEESRATNGLAELTTLVAKLASEVEKQHERARHREGVIDNLHAEAERLRIGERRGAVRPLLVAFGRLRDDLLRQATVLPKQFDREQARKLLSSFADTIEITLEDYGVAVETPRRGDDFSVRQHKVVASTPTGDPGLVRKIADVRRDGYRDIEVDIPIAQAEVTVYVAAVAHEPDPPPPPPVEVVPPEPIVAAPVPPEPVATTPAAPAPEPSVTTAPAPLPATAPLPVVETTKESHASAAADGHTSKLT